jgi:hypothetical protein
MMITMAPTTPPIIGPIISDSSPSSYVLGSYVLGSCIFGALGQSYYTSAYVE